ncbi:MAG: exopolyphosphatase [Azospirillum sp.]|nr:exopolyphosphatase [Azospirillum sp.]
MSVKKFRLVTRSDFDGLVCAVLLRELELVDEIKFVHPKDMQDGKIEITADDITTNLPYVGAAHLVFDHHSSELERVGQRPNHIIDADAPSAARVVWRHFGGRERFPNIPDEMMQAVDQADSAQYEKADILAPDGWTLLNFIMDARTGLGRFRDFRVSNYQLMMELIDACHSLTIAEILALPDVQERVDLYRAHHRRFIQQLERCARLVGHVVITDLRHEDPIWAGNRFMIYALNPTATVSIHVLWGLRQQNTVLAVGKSILNRASRADIGALMLSYGGGGHAAAGTCQVAHEDAERVLGEVVHSLNTAG